MIWTNSITNAVYTIISSFQSIVNSNVTVDLYAILNTSPTVVPWVNVNAPSIPVTPLRANVTQPFMANFTIPIIAQTGDYGGVENRWLALQELDSLTRMVMTAVNCNRTLCVNSINTVNMITGFAVEPFLRDDIQSDDFLQNQITIIAEVFA